MLFSFPLSRALVLVCSGIFFYMPFFALGAGADDVVINEVAWMGTKASSADEWIELKNTTGSEIDLSGWGIYEKGGEVRIIALTKKILPGGYYLIERTNDDTIADVAADDAGPFGGSGLSNSGEYVVLKDSAGTVINQVNAASGWLAGSASPDYMTMEREGAGWHMNDGTTRSGTDAKGSSINGTPRAQNSGVIVIPAAEIIPPVAPAPSPAPLPQAPAEQGAVPVSGDVPAEETVVTTDTRRQSTAVVEPMIIAQDEIISNEVVASAPATPSAAAKDQAIQQQRPSAKKVAKSEDIGENDASAVQPLLQGENTQKNIPQPALAPRAFGQSIYVLIMGAFGLVVWLSLRRRPEPVVEETEREE